MPYTNKEVTEIFEIMILHIKEHICADEPEKKKLSYEVLNVPLDQVPLFTEANEPHVRDLARWRLEKNK